MIKRFCVWQMLVSFIFFFGCQTGDQDAPGKINDLTFFTDPSALQFTNNSFKLGTEKLPAKTFALAWTATGDNKGEGMAALYDIKYISAVDAEANGLAAGSVCQRDSPFLAEMFNEPFPHEAGSPEIFGLIGRGLTRNQDYYFCLWAIDEIGQLSSSSQVSGRIPFIGVTLTSGAEPIPGLGQVARNIRDFSGDGLLDVASASPNQGNALVYYGRLDKDTYSNETLFGRELKIAAEFPPDLVITGDPAALFGTQVTGIDDLDKNGKADLAISAPGSSAGAVYLFGSTSSGSLSSADAWSVIDGISVGSRLGEKMAFCNDLNGDGYPDFAVAAPGAGKVYVVLGGSTAIPLGPIPGSGSIVSVASVVIHGDSSSGFGASLACGSDLNGDGIPDLLIGADQADNGMGDKNGAIYLFLGGALGAINFNGITSRNTPVSLNLTASDRADLMIFGETINQKFGESITMLGDIVGRSDADSSRDFAVGAPGIAPGKVYVFYGGQSGNLKLNSLSPPQTEAASQADIVLDGMSGEVIGNDVQGQADLDRDGHLDLSTGNGVGAVRVYYLVPGASPALLSSQLFQLDSPITSFELIPDLDQNGLAEVLVGIAGDSTAYLLK